MKKKAEVLCLLLYLLLLFSVSSAALPPPPPNFIINPPVFCVSSNGGIEICDGEDNDCNGLVDEVICENENIVHNNNTNINDSVSVNNSYNYVVEYEQNEEIYNKTIESNNWQNQSIENTSTNKSGTNNVIANSSQTNVQNAQQKFNQSTSETSDSKGSGFAKVILGIIIGVISIIGIFAFVYFNKKEDFRGPFSFKNFITTIKSYLNQKSTPVNNDIQFQGFNIQRPISASRYIRPEMIPVVKKVIRESKFSGLTSEEVVGMRYVIEMRRRGLNDNYIISQLKHKGWKDYEISKLLK